MTIRRGVDWGSPGRLSDNAPVFGDDRRASIALTQSLNDEGRLPNEIGLVGGDLHRTLGSPGHDVEALRSGGGMRFPVDVAIIRADDGEPTVVLSHLIALPRPNSRLFGGHTLIVMNAAFVGDLNLGPRAHPNDGRLDVTEGTMPRTDRRAARRRARGGAHVPHPALHESRTDRLEVDLGTKGMYLSADGEPVGLARELEVVCLADAIVVVV